MELDLYVVPRTKLGHKWIKGVQARPDAIESLEENVRENLFDISLSNDPWI